jgi:hypothetical protein
MLNEIFGAISTDPIPGIDAVIAAMQDSVDTAETDITNLETRITVVEATPILAYYARVSRSTNVTIPYNTLTKITWDTTDLDEGSLHTPDSTRLTIPSGADGLFQIRAVMEVEPRTNGDDCAKWLVQIFKNGTVLAEANTPHLNDGYNANSGTHTLTVGIIDTAVATDYYEVWVKQLEPGDSTTQLVYSGKGTYFEAVRLGPTS